MQQTLKKLGVLGLFVLGLAGAAWAQKDVLSAVKNAKLSLPALRKVAPPALPADFAARLQRQTYTALQKKELLRQAIREIFRKQWALYNLSESKNFQTAPGYTASPELLAEHQALLAQIKKILQADPRLFSNPVFGGHYMPVTVPSAFALKNNQIVLAGAKYLIQKIQWLESLPEQGRPYLQSLNGADAVLRLAKKLTGEKMIMLGEMHYINGIQNAVEELVLELHRLQPQRRIVVFTEFVDLPDSAAPLEGNLDTYFRNVKEETLEKLGDEDLYLRVEYAKSLFATLVRNGVDVYALEDRTLCNMITCEESPLLSEKNTARAIMLRNKTWARVIQRKMAEIRRRDPDALFIVYAGMGHTSWAAPYSIPKFFANEKPVVVEISPLTPTRLNTLSVVWGEDDPFFALRKETGLFYWGGPDAKRLGRNVGFDYMLILTGRQLWGNPNGL